MLSASGGELIELRRSALPGVRSLKILIASPYYNLAMMAVFAQRLEGMLGEWNTIKKLDDNSCEDALRKSLTSLHSLQRILPIALAKAEELKCTESVICLMELSIAIMDLLVNGKCDGHGRINKVRSYNGKYISPAIPRSSGYEVTKRNLRSFCKLYDDLVGRFMGGFQPKLAPYTHALNEIESLLTSNLNVSGSDELSKYLGSLSGEISIDDAMLMRREFLQSKRERAQAIAVLIVSIMARDRSMRDDLIKCAVEFRDFIVTTIIFKLNDKIAMSEAIGLNEQGLPATSLARWSFWPCKAGRVSEIGPQPGGKLEWTTAARNISKKLNERFGR